ncbi:isopenicillin N synthase family dioxygenase [Serratia surfactantfaciens]|uniref:isopenicillin N synthase family dioxygenase n=1 Tax=Serratia surfactantfaciens TaxID=2741499 RepID=UPI001B3C64A8|nr:isopenicillin N synthase family oxygenase [Serratia surfactantfaciens]
MSLISVPVIDLEPYFRGTDSGKLEVAKMVDRACRNIGFLIVKNHQIQPELIDRVMQLSRDFFQKPLAEKQLCERQRPDQVRGYSAIAQESLSYSLDKVSPGDLKESFSIGPDSVPDDEYYSEEVSGPHFAKNIWPEGMDAFRDAYVEYFDEMSKLAGSLMRIFALALNLPENFFDNKIDRHISMFRTLCYPHIKEDILPGQFRAGAHTDYGSLTIVKADSVVGGLQVKVENGEWVDVPNIDDCLIVNIGDLMQDWTNGYWVSTLHRVINPSLEENKDTRRHSLVFFHQPNYDAVIECLPGCIGSGAKNKPITSGEHLRSKFVKQTTFGGKVV